MDHEETISAVELRDILFVWMQALSAKPLGFVKCSFSGPYQEREVLSVESTLGRPLPESLRKLFLSLGKFEFAWFLKDLIVPAEFRLRGELSWDLYKIEEELQYMKELSAGTVMEDPWKEMIPFSYMNGDFLAVRNEDDSPVYCLRAEDPPDCAVRVGENITTYLRNMLDIGCVADADLLGFVDLQTGTVSSQCERAKEWRRWIHVG